MKNQSAGIVGYPPGVEPLKNLLFFRVGGIM